MTFEKQFKQILNEDIDVEDIDLNHYFKLHTIKIWKEWWNILETIGTRTVEEHVKNFYHLLRGLRDDPKQILKYYFERLYDYPRAFNSTFIINQIKKDYNIKPEDFDKELKDDLEDVIMNHFSVTVYYSNYKNWSDQEIQDLLDEMENWVEENVL